MFSFFRGYSHRAQSQQPAHFREKSPKSEQVIAGDEREMAAVRVTLVSAKDIPQALFVESQPPLAVITLPGSSQPEVELPSTAVPSGYLIWNTPATFSVETKATCSSSSVRWPLSFGTSAGGVGGSFRQCSFSGSGRRVAPESFLTAEDSEDSRTESIERDARRQGIRSIGSDLASKVVRVDLYSCRGRRKLLGTAAIPLFTASQHPGTSSLEMFTVEKRGLFSRRKVVGSIRACVVVDSLSRSSAEATSSR